MFLTLTNVKSGESASVIDAECNYYIIDKEANRNYAGKIERRSFAKHEPEGDASFDSQVFNEFSQSTACLLVISISQYLPDDDSAEKQQRAVNSQALGSVEGDLANDKEQAYYNEQEDFKKKTVKVVY